MKQYKVVPKTTATVTCGLFSLESGFLTVVFTGLTNWSYWNKQDTENV